MNTSGLILLANLLIISSVTLCLAQVSFSTNWGTGKRSPASSSIFKGNTDGNRRQSLYNNNNTPDDFQKVFRDRSENDVIDCLANFETNMMTFMSLLFESELRKAKQCILATRDTLYD